MDDFAKTVGAEVRRLRIQRKLIQRNIALQLGMTPSVLSRKERGSMTFTRDDIKQLITIFALNPEESLRLLMIAGYIPDPGSIPLFPGDLRAIASPWLQSLTFPALVFDGLSYVRVWNGYMEALYGLSQCSTGSIHWLDYLFSPLFQQRVSVRWEALIVQQLHDFYFNSLPLAQEPNYSRLLVQLKQKHGDEFVRLWEAVLNDILSNSTTTATPIAQSMLYWQSNQATLEFVIAHKPIAPMLSLWVLVPHGMLGQHTLQQVLAGTTAEPLYFRP